MNDLGKLNDILFAELDRLERCGSDDIGKEAERAKQIRDLSAQVIGNARTVMDVYRMRQSEMTDTAGQICVPKMLGGGEV